MNPVKRIQTRFFKTNLFRDILTEYVKDPDAVVVSREAAKDEVNKIISEKVPTLVSQGVQEEIQKVDIMRRNEALRYRNIAQINYRTDPDRKPGSDVPFSYLRRMAELYPIARACINRRVRQITQLEWDISTVDEIKDEAGFESQIKEVKNFFKRPLGHKTRMRELLTMMVNDVLTVDAVTFEMQKRRGGQFMHLIPVDPTTIALRVTETGGTPEPPDPAYVQFIQGKKIAEFTTDEMLYEMMGNRTYSPYGMAPLESLVLQAEAAIRGTLYNLNYFKENNIPEGFLTLPESVAGNKERVEEWQMWWDALMAGNQQMIHRLKILPEGSVYTPAKKPEDMAFEKFELWILQQTCAVFDVPPQDIGITYQVNKATSESQSDLSRERGLIPLGNFIKEIFDDLIQEEMGFEGLQFMWRNINPTDRKEEIDIAEKEINLGTMSVDEYRIEQGREPIGLTNYVKTTQGPVLVTDFLAMTPEERMGQGQNDNPNGNQDGVNQQDQQVNQQQKMELVDLRKWRKRIYHDLEEGNVLKRNFESDYITPEVYGQVQEGLDGVTSKLQAKLLFDQFLDPEVKASMTLLKFASHLRKIEHDATTASL